MCSNEYRIMELRTCGTEFSRSHPPPPPHRIPACLMGPDAIVFMGLRLAHGMCRRLHRIFFCVRSSAGIATAAIVEFLFVICIFFNSMAVYRFYLIEYILLESNKYTARAWRITRAGLHENQIFWIQIWFLYFHPRFTTSSAEFGGLFGIYVTIFSGGSFFPRRRILYANTWINATLWQISALRRAMEPVTDSDIRSKDTYLSVGCMVCLAAWKSSMIAMRLFAFAPIRCVWRTGESVCYG